MFNTCDFDRILKTECSFQHFTRNCRINNLDDFKRDETGVFVESKKFKREGERNDLMIHYEQVC